MILILAPNIDKSGAEYRRLMDHLEHLPAIQSRIHQEIGTLQTLTEIYLVGDTSSLDIDEMKSLPCVDRASNSGQSGRLNPAKKSSV